MFAAAEIKNPLAAPELPCSLQTEPDLTHPAEPEPALQQAFFPSRFRSWPAASFALVQN